MRFEILSVLMIVMTGCQTIRIVNDSRATEPATVEQSAWNHTGVFGIVNYSDDFYVEKLCGGNDWSSVTTERGAMTTLSRGAVLGVAAGATTVMKANPAAIFVLGNAFWDPVDVQWKCVVGSAQPEVKDTDYMKKKDIVKPPEDLEESPTEEK